jgi:hypothetical protein
MTCKAKTMETRPTQRQSIFLRGVFMRSGNSPTSRRINSLLPTQNYKEPFCFSQLIPLKKINILFL